MNIEIFNEQKVGQFQSDEMKDKKHFFSLGYSKFMGYYVTMLEVKKTEKVHLHHSTEPNPNKSVN
jgi:hypothetical protein